MRTCQPDQPGLPSRPLTITTAVGVALLLAGLVQGQQTGVHYPYSAALPPGTVGLSQLRRGGPVSGYFQPVELVCPGGGDVSLEIEGHFVESTSSRVRAGMLIGPVYRARVTNIPKHPGAEVYPTVEVINRLFPPPGEEAKFPIPIHITQEELELAMEGQFVTRVVYLEDRDTALPVRDDPNFQRYFEVHPRQDPLRVADELGRPMAILRMGSRVPDNNGQLGMDYGGPPLIPYQLPEELPAQEGQATPAEVKSVVPSEPAASGSPRSPAPADGSAAFKSGLPARPEFDRPAPYSAETTQPVRYSTPKNVLRFPSNIFRRRDAQQP